MELGRYEEAIDSFDAALEIDESHPSSNFNLAVALHEAGRTEQAIERLNSLLEGGGGGWGGEARRRAAEALLGDLQDDLEE